MAPSGLLLALDLGTTGVRAHVVAADGRSVAEASVPCQHDTPSPGRAEIDPERWWIAVQGACAELATRVDLSAVTAVAVVGQAPTAVLVDGSGTPLAPAILWLDVRATADARALEARLGPGVAESIGGNRMHAYFLGPKLAWLRAHAPGALDRAARVLQSHAFVAMRLTGEAACDPSTSMLCAPLYDAGAGAWSERGAAAVGVKTSQLPRILPAAAILGEVTAGAANLTRLLSGTPVVAGGGDFAASALGAGVVEEGQACLMLGTAGNLLLPSRTPRFDPRLLQSHHVGVDRWLSIGGTLCGAALEWFRRACAPGVPWEVLEAEAAAVPAGSDGVVMLPYLHGERAPVWDEGARGVFAGLELSHTRGHLYRAVLEGIALGFRHCLEIAREGGLGVTEALATDGAGQSPLFRQTLADALGVPVTWSSGTGTARGAAILAALGTGVLRDARGWGDAPAERHRHEPTAQGHAALREAFARRTRAASATR